MVVGLLMISILFGGGCGIAAFCTGAGLINSLIVYAIAGQVPFILLPLVLPLFASVVRDEFSDSPPLGALYSGELEGN